MSKIKWVVIQPLIGGLSLGAEQAIGNKPEFILSSEGIPNDQHLVSYWNDVPYLTLNGSGEFSTPAMKKQFDTLNCGIRCAIGVPVCAGLSKLSQTSNADSDQNENMYALARLAMDKINPEVYVFENAPGLYTKLGEKVKTKLRLIAEDFNYTTTMFKTDTFLHGIPQHRDRTFMYFWRQDTKEIKTPLLNWYKAKTPKIADYLKEIPEDACYNTKPNKFCNMEVLTPFIDYAREHIGSDWREIITDNGKKKVNTIAKYLIHTKTVSKFCKWVDGESYSDKIKAMMTKRILHSEKKILAGENYWEFSPVVLTTDSVNAITGKAASHFLHPTEDRGYTLRELMWLMGLPHDFTLVPNKNGSIEENHVAQNVPVKTARDIMINALDGINGKLTMLSVHHSKQNNHKQTLDEGNIESETHKLF